MQRSLLPEVTLRLIVASRGHAEANRNTCFLTHTLTNILRPHSRLNSSGQLCRFLPHQFTSAALSVNLLGATTTSLTGYIFLEKTLKAARPPGWRWTESLEMASRESRFQYALNPGCTCWIKNWIPSLWVGQYDWINRSPTQHFPLHRQLFEVMR